MHFNALRHQKLCMVIIYIISLRYQKIKMVIIYLIKGCDFNSCNNSLLMNDFDKHLKLVLYSYETILMFGGFLVLQAITNVGFYDHPP